MDSSLLLRTCEICFFQLLATIIVMVYRNFRSHQNNQTLDSSSLSLSSPSSSLSYNQTLDSSSLSLSSPSSSLSCDWNHHVFPSFHGADVRKSFLSHLLKELKNKGIFAFIDNNIERGKSIGPMLIEAIRASKIAVVLFSNNYASSSWCLNELVDIMKCRQELDQIVITIFYEVDPTDVKKQTGDFGKVFKRNCKGKTKEEIERWRKALAEVATIAGYHSNIWNNEAAMIEDIATDVSKKLISSMPSSDFDRFVGMRVHLEKMGPFLRLDLDEVRMIGILGPPGIGNNTVARFLFSQLSKNFQLSVFIENIKGCYPRSCRDEYGAKLQLQNQLLSPMINSKINMVKERLNDMKLLIVLDDIDQLGQLEALANDRWFGPGSRIVVTTQHLNLLKTHGINHIYKVDFPSYSEAFPSHGMPQLQNQLLSQMINSEITAVRHLGVLRERLNDKKVLVVLDDVDMSTQLDAMAKETRWFGPGSRIIVTTQHLNLLKTHGINHIYKVDFPSYSEAFQILCLHAFGQKSPKDGFAELAWEVTYLAGKFPLGLKVMGSYLQSMCKEEWIKAVSRLKTCLDDSIQSILKFCYDALDDEEKEVFLNIACSFNFERIEKLEEDLAKKIVNVSQRLRVLNEKSLISIEYGYIKMHTLLVQLGREISCPGETSYFG